MGASSELHIKEQENMRVKCSMPLSVYQKLGAYHEQIHLSGVYDPTLKDLYRENIEWMETSKTIAEAYKKRTGIEEQIRVEKAIENDKCG